MFKKIILCLLMLVIATGTTIGCGKKDNSGGGNNVSKKAILWSAPSTKKYMLNEKPETYGDSNLVIDMVINESEGVQLIITPKENIDSYKVTASDLVSGDNRIKAENIELLCEHYVYLGSSKNTELIKGFYPDALLPMDIAENYKENKIRKDQNQAIYVNVTTPKDTVKGTYKGELSVKLEDETTKVPITVNVANVVMPTKTSSKSCFAIWDEGNFLHGYYNNSEDYYTKYYDYLLEYRISGKNIPGTQYESSSVNEWVDAIEKYAFNEKVGSYCLPYTRVTMYDSAHDSNHNFYDEDKMEQLFVELIKRSTNEKNLLEKAFVYFDFCDEPPVSEAWRIKKTDLAFHNLKDKIYNNKALYPSDGSKDKVRESVLKVNHVGTVADHDIYNPIDENGKYVGGMETFCPLFSEINDNASMQNFKERTENGLKTWFYGCVYPFKPYPSYHVDDNSVSPRLISWMQNYYGFDGELYWVTNLTQGFNLEHWKYWSLDPWNDPYSYYAPGDGLIVYPGHKYNIDGPMSCLRLQSIKDGKEDWELLNMLRNDLENASLTYKQKFKIENYIQKMVQTMFYGTKVIDDPENFLNMRKELIELIELIESPDNIVVDYQTSDVGSKSTVKVYVNKEAEISINNKKITGETVGEGYCYSSDVYFSKGGNYASIKISTNGTTKEINRFLGTSQQLYANFNSQSDLSKIGKTDGAKSFQGQVGEPINDTKISLNSESTYSKSGSSLKFEYRGVKDNRGYKPGVVLLDVGNNYVNYSSLGKIRFSVYNKNDADIRLSLSISTKNSKGTGTTALVVTDYCEIKANAWTDVELNVTGKSSLDLSAVSKILITTDNPLVEENGSFTELQRVLYFDNVMFVDKIVSNSYNSTYVESYNVSDGFSGLYDVAYNPKAKKIDSDGIIFDYENVNDIPYYTSFIGFEGLNAEISINENSEYVSHGNGSLKLKCVTSKSSKMVDIYFRIPDEASDFTGKYSTISFDVINPMQVDISGTLVTDRITAGYSNLLGRSTFTALQKTTVSYNLKELIAPKAGEPDYREDVSLWRLSISLPPQTDIVLYFDNFRIN